jgi:hypothetical protein
MAILPKSIESCAYNSIIMNTYSIQKFSNIFDKANQLLFHQNIGSEFAT